jgi:hypothetical protein
MVAFVDSSDDPVLTFEGKRYPPGGECRLRIQTVSGGIICNLDGIRFFKVCQAFPGGISILIFGAQVPSSCGFLRLQI